MQVEKGHEKGHNSVKYVENLPKVNQVIYTLDTYIMILAQAALLKNKMCTRLLKYQMSKKGHIIQSNI